MQDVGVSTGCWPFVSKDLLESIDVVVDEGEPAGCGRIHIPLVAVLFWSPMWLLLMKVKMQDVDVSTGIFSP